MRKTGEFVSRLSESSGTYEKDKKKMADKKVYEGDIIETKPGATVGSFIRGIVIYTGDGKYGIRFPFGEFTTPEKLTTLNGRLRLKTGALLKRDEFDVVSEIMD